MRGEQHGIVSALALCLHPENLHLSLSPASIRKRELESGGRNVE